jgi:hypothetical protein
MHGDASTVRALVGRHVDVNAPGRDGTRALHWVVRANDLATATLLIQAGANVAAANRYGVTPLHLASVNGNAAMIRALVDAGADANSADGNEHNHEPLPVLLAGGGSGALTGGRHIQAAPHTTMSNLLLAVLDKFGVKKDKFGDSTGVLSI